MIHIISLLFLKYTRKEGKREVHLMNYLLVMDMLIILTQSPLLVRRSRTVLKVTPKYEKNMIIVFHEIDGDPPADDEEEDRI